MTSHFAATIVRYTINAPTSDPAGLLRPAGSSLAAEAFRGFALRIVRGIAGGFTVQAGERHTRRPDGTWVVTPVDRYIIPLDPTALGGYDATDRLVTDAAELIRRYSGHDRIIVTRIDIGGYRHTIPPTAPIA
jgi:hypothetical protein